MKTWNQNEPFLTQKSNFHKGKSSLLQYELFDYFIFWFGCLLGRLKKPKKKGETRGQTIKKQRKRKKTQYKKVKKSKKKKKHEKITKTKNKNREKSNEKWKTWKKTNAKSSTTYNVSGFARKILNEFLCLVVVVVSFSTKTSTISMMFLGMCLFPKETNNPFEGLTVFLWKSDFSIGRNKNTQFCR